MSRRDSIEHDTDRDDHQEVGPMTLQYIRLRCLELAVRMHHPDDEVKLDKAEFLAGALLRFIMTGVTTEEVIEKLKEANDEVSRPLGGG
jgi:hypothetical protein